MTKNSTVAPFSALYTWVLSFFFFSGMAGLIYQILWLRMIDKVIGSAPFAVSTILSVFMGGLALGSFVAGKHIDRIGSRGNLLALYGKIEIAIGLYGLLLPLIILGLKPLYVLVYDALFLHFWAYRLFTFFGCALILIVPTALMGATLPILCRFCVEDLGHVGRRTGRLYGINTIGAAAGALLCGFVLIAALGVWGTLVVAVGINLLIGILSMALVRKDREPVSTPVAVASGQTARDNTAPDNGIIPLSLWIFAVSGFSAMAYEVFWTRLLGLIIGPTTYSFSLVVATFVIGLALGNLLFGWLADRTRGAFTMLVVTQAVAACLALLVSQFFGSSQFFFSKLLYTFQGSFGVKTLVQSITLFLVMVGPTIFLGATFPLVNRIYARSLPTIGRSVGRAYAVNTVGAILGSFTAGFILIPFVGKENGLKIAAGLQLFISITAMTYLTVKAGKNIRTTATALGALIISLVLLVSFPSWNHEILSKGWYYRFGALETALTQTSWTEALFSGTSKISPLVADRELLFYGDGAGGFTTVDRYVDPTGTANYILLNSGKSDASSHNGRLTQALCAHIPLLFHPDPENVMILGLASGMTAGEALHYPLEQLDVVEINDQVIEAAEFFTPFNNDCLENPKTRVIAQDGRNHLELTKEAYDVIISVPSNPWMAGMANIFSLDYFQTVKRRLGGDGIFAQWISSYDMDWETFSMIGRTFAEVFPDGLLIRTMGTSEFLLVGFGGEKNLDLDVARKNLAYAGKSTNVTIKDPLVIFDLIVTEDLQGFFKPGLLHTDIWPRLEFTAPKNMGSSSSLIAEKIREKSRLSAETQEIIDSNDGIDNALDYIELLTAGSAPPFDDVDLEEASSEQLERYYRMVSGYCKDAYVSNYSIFPTKELRRECARVQTARIQAHLAESPEDAAAHFRLAVGLEAMGEYEAQIDALRAAISLTPAYFDAHMELGETLSLLGDYDGAADQLREALTINPNSAEAYNNLGNVFADRGDAEGAIPNFKKALKIDPDFVQAYNNLGCVYAGMANDDEAIYYLTKAIDRAPEYADAHDNLGRVFADQERLEEALVHFLEAVRIAPGNAEFRNDAGLAQGRQGQTEASIEHFTEALRLDPNMAVARYNLGLALLDTGQEEKAAGHLAIVAEAFPDDPDVHNILGAVLGNLGRFEEAAGHLTRAVDITPDAALAHDNLGLVLLQLGRIEEAIDHFHAALDIDESLDVALSHLKIAVQARENGDGSSPP